MVLYCCDDCDGNQVFVNRKLPCSRVSKAFKKENYGTFAFALHGIQINLVGDFAAVKTNQIITG